MDLDLSEVISAFELEVECTNGATSNLDNYISDIVTKIEVVDGSDVLHSLNMSQLEALYFYKTGKAPCLFPSEWAGGVQRHNVQMLFGRYLWDPLFGLDPAKYKNPQLKVTFNKAAIRAAAADGFAAGDNILLTVVPKVMDEITRPTKFLMAKQIESFTSVASGEKRVDLPTDYTYRSILMRLWKQGSDVDEIITDAKLTCDTDKFIPFNRKVKQLDAAALRTFGLVEIKHDILRAHGATVRLLCNKEPHVTPQLKTGVNDIMPISWEWSSQFYLNLFVANTGGNDGTARNITLTERGHALHATVPVLFGRYDVPEDWFNPTTWKKFELVLTQAVAAATCEIVIEQVRPQ